MESEPLHNARTTSAFEVHYSQEALYQMLHTYIAKESLSWHVLTVEAYVSWVLCAPVWSEDLCYWKLNWKNTLIFIVFSSWNIKICWWKEYFFLLIDLTCIHVFGYKSCDLKSAKLLGVSTLNIYKLIQCSIRNLVTNGSVQYGNTIMVFLMYIGSLRQIYV